ncbi:MAG: hypothetical protein LBS81_05520 [Endomicrobium sp.]|jgi:magnesium chelatase family protein|nr:hypothetical protein [Endomicrobium sp.]
MDRIDLHIDMPPLKFSELSTFNDNSESSANIRKRVIEAREIQNARFKESGIYANAQMQSKEIKKYCILDDNAYETLKTAIEKLNPSAVLYKILKVSRTIADLAGSNNYIAETLQYRFFDKC